MKRTGFLAGLLLSIALYTGLYIAFFTDVSKALYINIVFRNIYIPVIGWFLILLYAVLWSRLFSEKLSTIVARSVLLGISVHIPILLCKLNIQFAAGSPLSRIYLYYVMVVTIAVMAALFTGSARVLQRVIVEQDKQEIFFMPVCFAFLQTYYIYATLYCAPVLLALVFGLLAAYLMLRQKPFLSVILNRIRLLMSNDFFIIGVLFTLGFALRVFFSIQMLKATGGGSTFVDGSDDGRTYDAIGWAIAKNGASLFSKEYIPTVFDPAYSLFLSVVYKIFGHNFHAATFIQSAINGILPVVTYFIGRLLFSRKVGILAGALLCFDQAAIMHSVVLGTEALFPVLLALSLLFFILYFKGPPKAGYLVLTGAFFGLCVITRYMLLMMPIFMFIALLFVKGMKFRKKIAAIAIISMVGLLLILPITTLNYINTGEFHLVERSSDRIHTVWYGRYPGMEDRSPSNMRLVEIGFDPFRRPVESLLFIFKHPVKLTTTYAEILSKRLCNFFFWPNFGFSDPILLLNPSRAPNEFGSTIEFYLFVVYLVGLAVTVRRIPKERAVVILFIAFSYFIFIHVILFMFSTPRYRVPVIPYQMIILSAGFFWIRHFVSQKLTNCNIKIGSDHAT